MHRGHGRLDAVAASPKRRQACSHVQVKGAMVASWVSQASFEPLGLTVAVAKDRAIESLLQARRAACAVCSVLAAPAAAGVGSDRPVCSVADASCMRSCVWAVCACARVQQQRVPRQLSSPARALALWGCGEADHSRAAGGGQLCAQLPGRSGGGHHEALPAALPAWRRCCLAPPLAPRSALWLRPPAHTSSQPPARGCVCSTCAP